MIRNSRQPIGLWRHVYLTLAALAIAVKVMVPPGFMAAASSQDPAFALVLCTDKGAVTIQADDASQRHGQRDHAPAKTAHDSPCAFAGHGLGAPPPALHDTGRAEFVAYQPPVLQTAIGLAPGRGLAGPPLPARGPPSQLI